MSLYTTFQRKPVIVGASALIVLVALVWALAAFLGNKDRELAAALKNILGAETLHTKTELVIHLPRRMGTVDRPFTEILFRVDGDMQKASDSTPEVSGQLLVEARGRGNVFFADGDIRILKDEVLFNLENLPVFFDPKGRLIKRWTRVETSLLTSSNGEQIKTALASAATAVKYAGKEKIDDTTVLRFHGALTSEQEEALYQVVRHRASGNQALSVIARLLQANNVDSLDIWVDSSAGEIRRIAAHFARPLSNGNTFDFATLTMDFSDYGQPVTIDHPEAKGRVQPQVFGRILGSGDFEEIQAE